MDRSLALEPGLAASLLAEEDSAQQAQQVKAQEAALPQKKAAGGRRKSMAAAVAVASQPAVAPAEEAPQLQPALESVADEVAALNAEMCAALTGLVGEESPPQKGPRCAHRVLVAVCVCRQTVSMHADGLPAVR